MIAALKNHLVPFPLAVVPGIASGQRARDAGGEPAAGGRRPRPPMNVVIDPYLGTPADIGAAETAQIYDRRLDPVLIGPPVIGQLVNIYA